MNQFTLTKKETEAFKVIVDQALREMGGNEPKDLHDDNFSWFNRTDISEGTGFNKNEAAGLMSSMEEKMIVENYDPGHEFGWCITEPGIDVAQSLFGGKVLNAKTGKETIEALKEELI